MSLKLRKINISLLFFLHVLKYLPLANYLKNLDQTSITMSFSQIEDIINSSLPASAFKYKEWWANDTISHVQSRLGWLTVEWKTMEVDLDNKCVIFMRAQKSRV